MLVLRARGGGTAGGAAAPAATKGIAPHDATDPAAERAALFDLVRRVSLSVGLQNTVDLLASGLRELADAAGCDIWIPDGDCLKLMSSCDPQGFDRTTPDSVLQLERYPVTRQALDEARAIAVGDLDEARLCETERAAMRRWGFASFLDVPMQISGKVVALVELCDIVPRDFSAVAALLDDGRDALAGAFSKVALLDRLEQSNHELRSQNRRLTALLDAGRAITSTLLAADVLHSLARKTAEAVGAPECLIYEFDLAESTMTVRSDYIADGHAASSPVAEGSVYQTVDSPRDLEILLGGVPVQESLSDPDLDPASRRSMLQWGEQSILNVPFAFGDQPLGLLVIVETARERRFTPKRSSFVGASASRRRPPSTTRGSTTSSSAPARDRAPQRDRAARHLDPPGRGHRRDHDGGAATGSCRSTAGAWCCSTSAACSSTSCRPTTAGATRGMSGPSSTGASSTARA